MNKKIITTIVCSLLVWSAGIALISVALSGCRSPAQDAEALADKACHTGVKNGAMAFGNVVLEKMNENQSTSITIHISEVDRMEKKAIEDVMALSK